MTVPSQAVPLLRASLVTVSDSQVKRGISFQYNPETVRRTLEPNTVGGRPGSRSQAVRFAGAPVETLTLDCRFSTSGGADAGDAEVAQDGIAPALAALALLAYPATQHVLAAQALLDAGTIEVIPPPADELLLVFGQRVLPCEVQGMSIVEQLYDANLTPVLATVTLTLRAVTYSDVSAANPAFGDFIAYQQALEQLAGQRYNQGPSGP